MDMFNCDDVATLLAKRKQKFVGSFARMDNILCERAAVVSNCYYYYYFSCVIDVVIIALLFVFFCMAVLTTK